MLRTTPRSRTAYNPDGKVDTADQNLARMFASSALNAPRFINIPLSGPLVPIGAVPIVTTADNAVASALAVTPTTYSAPKPQVTGGVSKGLDHTDANSGPVAKLFQQLADSNTPAAKKILIEADRIADALGLDDELLDDLVKGLLA